MTPSQSPAEKAAADQAATNASRATTTQDAVLSDHSDLKGAIADSPYYANEVKAGTSGTTQGYDAARDNMKRSMEAAGVTGRSGVTAGNETALSAQEARDLATVRTNAYSDTEEKKLAADSQDIGIAGQETGAGTTYSGQSLDASNKRQAQGASNWANLGKAVATFGA